MSEISECSICYDAIMRSDCAFTVLSCGHPFHLGCISDWFILSSEPSCPICRKKASEVDIPTKYKVKYKVKLADNMEHVAAQLVTISALLHPTPIQDWLPISNYHYTNLLNNNPSQETILHIKQVLCNELNRIGNTARNHLYISEDEFTQIMSRVWTHEISALIWNRLRNILIALTA